MAHKQRLNKRIETWRWRWTYNLALSVHYMQIREMTQCLTGDFQFVPTHTHTSMHTHTHTHTPWHLIERCSLWHVWQRKQHETCNCVVATNRANRASFRINIVAAANRHTLLSGRNHNYVCHIKILCFDFVSGRSKERSRDTFLIQTILS